MTSKKDSTRTQSSVNGAWIRLPGKWGLVRESHRVVMQLVATGEESQLTEKLTEKRRPVLELD